MRPTTTDGLCWPESLVFSMCPASILRFHERAAVVVDEAAAGLLERHDYYAYVYDDKPRRSACIYVHQTCVNMLG